MVLYLQRLHPNSPRFSQASFSKCVLYLYISRLLRELTVGNSSKKAINERLTHTPAELQLVALAQFSVAADTEVVRYFPTLTFPSSTPPPVQLP